MSRWVLLCAVILSACGHTLPELPSDLARYRSQVEEVCEAGFGTDECKRVATALEAAHEALGRAERLRTLAESGDATRDEALAAGAAALQAFVKLQRAIDEARK